MHTAFFRKEFAFCSWFDVFCSIIPPALEEEGIVRRRRRCLVVASARNIRQMPRRSEESVVHFCARRYLLLSFRSEQPTLIADAGNERSVAKRIPEIKQDSACEKGEK